MSNLVRHAERIAQAARGLGVGTLATATLVTIPLVLIANNPVRIVQIHIVPSSPAFGQLPCTTATTRTYGGPAWFQFEVVGLPADVRKVALNITPEDGKAGFRQDDYLVQGGTASGRAQLGSGEYPIAEDYTYKFLLADSDSEATLMRGDIVARVEEVAAPAPWILLLIGAIASTIQVLDSVKSRRNAARPSSE